MRLVILWFCVALWASSPAVAQRQAIDSLYKIAHNLKQKPNYQQDTAYLNVLHEIAYSYDSVKPDSMLIVAQQFKELAEKAKYERGISRALQDIGVYYYGIGNYTKALEHLLEALRIAEKIQHLKSLASCYNNIALIYQVQNKADKALDYHFKVLKIRDKTNDEARKATTFNNIGTIYSERKESEKSLEYHYKALEINQKYNDLQGTAYNYNNIGFEYRILKKTDEAVQCLEKALKIVKEIGDEDMEAEVYYNLSACELQRKNLPEALTLAQKSFEMGKKLHKILSMQGAHELLSKIYEAMGKFDLALEHHKLTRIFCKKGCVVVCEGKKVKSSPKI
jgi:tetratricopeptide (TPR) repeat protein